MAKAKKEKALKNTEKRVIETGSARIKNKLHSYLKYEIDEDSGQATINPKDARDCFFMGTHDTDLVNTILSQVSNSCTQGNGLNENNVTRANGTLAAILEIDPQDSTELMLATQMATVHNKVMSMSCHLSKGDQSIEVAKFYTNSVAKLMRTFTTQIEALTKYRNKGKQKITVKHQNVNVNDGGQAVIGDVGGGGNG